MRKLVDLSTSSSLGFYLENNKFSFWNLGHPYMQYKFDLGAKLYAREEFLKKWLVEIQ